MTARSLMVLGYKVYAVAVPLSWFFLILYNWWLEFACLQCTFNVWEPNLIIHEYEFILMILAVPGIIHMVWRYLN